MVSCAGSNQTTDDDGWSKPEGVVVVSADIGTVEHDVVVESKVGE